jgi:Sulfatase
MRGERRRPLFILNLTFAGYVENVKLKLSLIAASLLWAFPAALARVDDLGLSFSLLLFLGLFALLLGSIVTAAFVQSPALRWMYALMLASGAAFSASFSNAIGHELTYDGFTNMWNSRAFVGDAFAQFGTGLALGGLHGGLVFFGVGLKPSARTGTIESWRAWVPAITCALMSVLIYKRGGEGTGGLPGAFVAPAFAAVHSFDSVANAPGPRQPVGIARAASKLDHDIVLVVDESIGAAYLDINGLTGVYSGLGVKRAGVAIHNFGVAASITNCSMGSNVALRFGGKRENYRDVNATGPSIWSYAKRAGLQTVYVDAQRTGGAYQNGMDDAERAGIDRWIQFDDVPVMNRDQAVANSLATLLNDGTSQYIFVNKMGGHFPVNAKYPESRKRFKPEAPRDAFAGVAEKSARDVFNGGVEEWRLYRNAYRNTIEWNVGAFFDRLFTRAKLGDAVIIYTSDHGQNLHERGDGGHATHCTPDPAAEEGAVPLVVVTGDAVDVEKWQAAAARGRNASSHYRIFPTLLDQMGYNHAAVQREYGESLDSDRPDTLTFNTLFNARLGRDPVWKTIIPEKLVQPPVSDFQAKP